MSDFGCVRFLGRASSKFVEVVLQHAGLGMRMSASHLHSKRLNPSYEDAPIPDEDASDVKLTKKTKTSELGNSH